MALPQTILQNKPNPPKLTDSLKQTILSEWSEYFAGQGLYIATTKLDKFGSDQGVNFLRNLSNGINEIYSSAVQKMRSPLGKTFGDLDAIRVSIGYIMDMADNRTKGFRGQDYFAAVSKLGLDLMDVGESLKALAANMGKPITTS